MPVLQDAEAAKVGFYTRPDLLRADDVDPLIWPAVERINESGWCWTAESCQGHPDDDGNDPYGPWAGNTRPMLRLVCRREDYGRMLALLSDAAWFALRFADGEYNRDHALGFEVYPTHKSADWRAVLVYVKATTVGDRRRGLAMFERFAESAAAQAVAQPQPQKEA